MTPKEKAKELVDKYCDVGSVDLDDAKYCAIVAVEEILEDDMYDMSEELFEKRINYWQEVEQEIKKL